MDNYSNTNSRKEEKNTNLVSATSPGLQNQDVTNTDTTAQNEQGFDLKRSAHPVAAAFHILFKLAGILVYFLLYFLTDLKVTTFILIVLCAAFDFWTVKNITGRLLVGLKWGSEILDDGTEKWKFESYDEKIIVNPFDKTLFWWSQAIVCILWVALSILKLVLFDFFWATAAIVCWILSWSNLIGFFRCSRDHQKKVKDLMRNAAMTGMKKNLHLVV